MNKLLALLCFLPVISSSAPTTITKKTDAGTVKVQFDRARYAGAITFVSFGGRSNMIDTDDAGRLVQTAVSYDGMGECYNPTEGGSAIDGGFAPSKSVLLSGGADAQNATLNATTQMAFWLPPGIIAWCGKADYTKALSDHKVTKSVTVTPKGVLDFRITIISPEYRSQAQFEVLTGYMQPRFSKFWTFNRTTKTTSPLSITPAGEQFHPLIFSTPSGSEAIGIICEGSPETNGGGYGRFDFGADTKKWNVVWRTTNFGPGSVNYRCFVPVGSFNKVKAEMTSISNSL